MGKNKLIRFAEMKDFGNTFEFPENMPGTWHAHVFRNNNPIVLDLACGRGEYSVGLAREFPLKNIIGVDIKGARLWRGAKTAWEEGVSNAAFLRTYIENIATYFAPGEVSEIWITFPDPHLRPSRSKKRLSSLRFLKEYSHFLRDGGLIHLKTDDDMLYHFTKAGAKAAGISILDDVRDVLNERSEDSLLSIRTTYEKRWIAEGKHIKYLQLRLAHSAFTAPGYEDAKKAMSGWTMEENQEA